MCFNRKSIPIRVGLFIAFTSKELGFKKVCAVHHLSKYQTLVLFVQYFTALYTKLFTVFKWYMYLQTMHDFLLLHQGVFCEKISLKKTIIYPFGIISKNKFLPA